MAEYIARPRVCTIDGCEREVASLGWCSGHYQRNRKYGDPLGGGPSPGAPKALIERKLSELAPDDDECWTWPHADNGNGYPVIHLNGRLQYVHRLVYERVVGPIPPGLQIRHMCGRGRTHGCWNPNHLDVGTHKQNMADKVIHRSQPSGERHTHTKLTEAQVLRMRAEHAEGKPIRQISEELEIGYQTIWAIVRRKSWRYV